MNIEADQLAQMYRLFDELIDVEADLRAQRLDEIEGADPALAQQLRALLDADANPVRTETAVSRLAAMTVLPAGTVLGAYRIEHLLGAGGMGHVYLARRCDGRADHAVAIKTLRTSLDAVGLGERFRRERRLLAKLEHPNIARFIDAGETPDGMPYVILEYIDGIPLLDYAARQQLNLRDRLHLALAVARAVEHAHRHLILHRDVKPGNVIVDARGVPKLLDFGLADTVDGSAQAASEDGDGQQYFSLAYAAPEQIRGTDDGATVDVYGLGGLCYELFAGRAPFDLESMPFAAARELLLSTAPPPPSARAGNGLPYQPGALKGDIDSIVLHCLEKEPTQRYPSAAALADDLQRVIALEPISLRAGERLYRLRRLYQRHRVASVLSALLVAGLIAAGLIFRHQRDVAIAERERATVVSDLLVEAFRAADPNRTEGNEVSARQIVDQARLAIARHTGLDSDTNATLLTTLAEVYYSLGAFDIAGELAGQAVGLSESDDFRIAAEYWRQAAGFARGDAIGARAQVARMLAAIQPPDVWHFRFRHLGLSVERQLNQVPIKPLADQLYADSVRWLGEQHPLTVSAKIASIQVLSLDADSSDDAVRQAESLLKSLETDRSINNDTLTLWRLAGRLYRRSGRHAQALQATRKTLEIAGQLYGEQHRSYLMAQASYALDLLQGGELLESRQAFEDALNRSADIEGDTSATRATIAFNGSAAFLREPIDAVNALRFSQIALDIGHKLWPPDTRQLGFFWARHAAALLAANQAQNAIQAVDNARRILASSPDDSAKSLVELELLAGIAEHRSGQADAATRRLATIRDRLDQLPDDSIALRMAQNEMLLPIQSTPQSPKERKP